MGLSEEERKYALELIQEYASFIMKPGVDFDKFFRFIEADEDGKRQMIKEYINGVIIPAKEELVNTYSNAITTIQAELRTLSEKVK